MCTVVPNHPLQILVVIFNIIWIAFVLDAEVEPAGSAGEEGKKYCKKGAEAPITSTGDVEAGAGAAASQK